MNTQNGDTASRPVVDTQQLQKNNSNGDEGEPQQQQQQDEQLTNLNHNELRLAANARFAANALDEALPLYSLAVDVVRCRIAATAADETAAVTAAAAAADNNNSNNNDDGNCKDYTAELIIQLCNRSACYYKMEMYNEAKIDALEAVELCAAAAAAAASNTHHGSYCKALFRLARTQLALEENDDAIESIGRALTYCDERLNHYSDDNNIDDGEGEKKERMALTAQRNEFQKLLNIAKRKKQQSSSNNKSNKEAQDDIQSIKLEPRTPSIREFNRPSKVSDNYHPLGEGNFSTVVICQHKITKETFALKIIEKEQCLKLAKRQHPNVHNEVLMEKRILTQQRLPPHVNIVRAYHTMSDYTTLYFLMELHEQYGDLWSLIKYDESHGMVGMHPSLIRIYMYELLSAVEHCHKHGIVHRDIKPENVLLSERNGHVILIDFGTAKDLIQTDLNGPEFVGTPDFMSPEAVREFDKGGPGCDFTADLWALGVMIYQMYAGALPFEAASPYMTFLKIQRGVMNGRSMGIYDDDAWDLIGRLLKVDPKERLGAGCFEWIPPPSAKKKKDDNDDGVNVANDDEEEDDDDSTIGRVIEHGMGYDIIRQHPFFAKHTTELEKQTNSHLDVDTEASHPAPQPIPSLRDLAVRATALFIDQSSLDVDLEDDHPPGDGSSFDALRLKPAERASVMHLLDRLHLLKEPRVYRRFFPTKQEARLGRIRPESRDALGLTQINDKMGQFPGRGEDENHPANKVPSNLLSGDMKVCIQHITNPLFCKVTNDECSNDEVQRKAYIKQLKESIRLVNRTRPKVVVACGYFDESCRKLLSKINEGVPVILHDGSAFFNFWVYGAHCLAVRLKDFAKHPDDNGGADDRSTSSSRKDAMSWLKMELEQIKTARSHGYLFVDGSPHDIPEQWRAHMGKNHVLGVLGQCSKSSDDVAAFEEQFVVAEQRNKIDDDDISAASSNSDDSNAPPDEHVMNIVGRYDNGVRCITVHEEELEWDAELLL
jgi:serine/threonine protein kinase